MTSSGLDALERSVFPELAAIVLARRENVIRRWAALARRVLPRAAALDAVQLRDHLSETLAKIAAALASDVPATTSRLTETAPEHGVTRFHQHYDLAELLTEHGLLRRVIIEQAEADLDRPMSLGENVALNAAVDVVLNGAVMAYSDLQQSNLRAAAEAELKFLTFLSHDLRNNLSSVTLWLRVHRDRLRRLPEFADDVARVGDVQRAIADTVGGMERLLESERMRKQGREPESAPVDLRVLASNAAAQFAGQAEQKGMTVSVDVEAGVACTSDAGLIALVLQNLVGNAVKHSSRGTVRVHSGRAADGGGCVLSVSDEGPGIAPQYLKHVFDAFRRGESRGQEGVGLGLTIAAQAAKLLGAELTVRSKVGVGSTFSLTLGGPTD